jgi:hypothetical protein
VRDSFGYVSALTGDSVVLNNIPPRIVHHPDTLVYKGRVYIDTLRATDRNGDALRYRIISRPAGMAISCDSVAGVISWPTAGATIGVYPLVTQVQDGRGGVARDSFMVKLVFLYESALHMVRHGIRWALFPIMTLFLPSTPVLRCLTRF